MTQSFPTAALAGAELDTVPEPASAALLGVGCLVLWGIVRVRKAIVQ